MPIDPEALLSRPQCNDPRIDAAWTQYQSYALANPPLRTLRLCGRCDSEAIAARDASHIDRDEVALVCRDCKYAVVWPIDRAYWMWRRFVHPQNPMIDWKVDDGKVTMFERDRRSP